MGPWIAPKSWHVGTTVPDKTGNTHIHTVLTLIDPDNKPDSGSITLANLSSQRRAVCGSTSHVLIYETQTLSLINIKA